MKRFLTVAITAVLVGAAAMPASATIYDWTTWTGSAIGAPGSAAGTAGSVGVTYAGDLINLQINYPSWTPVSTWAGGPVSNAPPSSGGMIGLNGGNQHVNTVKFSTAVLNPAIAIWSLGTPGAITTFDFAANPNFSIVAGGPSAEFGGSALFTNIGFCNATSACGSEGNGTVVFNGTYNSVSWTNPQFENYYGFTVGVEDRATPEPGFYALLGLGLTGLAVVRRRLTKNS